MKKILLPFMMLLFMSLMACSDDNDASVTPNDRKDIVLSRSETQMATENVKFAFALFNKMNELETEKPNWMVSPFSASVALSMIANGTDGNTLTELQNVLGLSDFSLEEMNEYNRKLNVELPYLDNTTKLCVANSIWADKEIDMYGSFINTNKDVYDAQISTLDFSLPNALENINSWCAKQTENTIPEILDDMPEGVKVCFLNTLYFKGTWKEKFSESATENETFYCMDGQQHLVKMMKQTEDFYYCDNKTFAMAEFPYGNEAFSMIVLLPHEDKTLEETLQEFTVDYWAEIEMSKKELNVCFPRFEMNYETDLIQVMRSLGVSDIFDEEKADFSRLSSIPMYLNLLKQATYIKVDEKGTEAAAVSVGTGMVGDSGPAKTIDFFMNRPFAFLIKEKSTGNILFMGKVTAL